MYNFTHSMLNAEQNKISTRSVSARLCGDLTGFERHIEYWAQRKNPRPCEACGADSYTICGWCNVPLHFFPQIGYQTRNTFFIKYHSDTFFGLACSDSTLLGKTKNEWKEPSKRTLDQNEGYIRRMQAMNMES